jgi:hypothetical protein
MEYADIVWAGGNVTDLDKLEMVQKDAARVVTGATARCSTSLLMDDIGLSIFHVEEGTIDSPYFIKLSMVYLLRT